jgi:hypothetical protein
MPPFLIKRKVKCGSNPQRLTKLKERVGFTMENEKKVLNLNELFDEVEMTKDEFEKTARLNFVYKEVLEKYMQTKAVVEFNLMVEIEKVALSCKTLDEFGEYLNKAIQELTSKTPTRIEKIELQLIKRIYRDVVKGKGQLYDGNKIATYYDGQKVEFSAITFDDLEKGNIIQ